jgi:hypothetical protein
MGARGWLNAGLLALVAALIALVVYEPGHDETHTVKLTALQADNVRQLRISRANQEDIELQRDAGRWWIAAPVRSAANQRRIEALLGVLTTTSRSRFTAAGRDLEKYGLAKPQASLMVDGTTIAFGNTEHITHRRYVLYGDAVHLITDNYYHQLKIELPSFVSPALLPPGRRPAAIVLPERSLRRDDTGRWNITPPPADTSADAGNILADAWRTTRVGRIKRYAQEPVDAHIRIELDDGATLSFGVYTTEDSTFLVREDLGIQYRLAQETAQRLLHLPAAGETATTDQP